MNASPRYSHLALAISIASTCLFASASVADECVDAAPAVVYQRTVVVPQTANHQPSWIFHRGTYTHDPYTGARVAQFQRIPPVEPLDDERLVTSRYRRSRTNLRGIDGSIDTYHEVQNWNGGHGGLDAEWERFHEAWKESFLSGGSFFSPGYGYGYGSPGYGFPGYGHPGYGHPGYGHPGYGHPGYGGLPPFHGGHSFPPHGDKSDGKPFGKSEHHD